MTDKVISPLRQRLIDDMTIRRLSPKTKQHYIRHVKNFADFVGRSPDKATAEEVRRYQLQLASIGTTVPTVNISATALRFFFKVTLRRTDLAAEVVSARGSRRLPVVLSPEEVCRLLALSANIKHKAALSLAYATGLRASERSALQCADRWSRKRSRRDPPSLLSDGRGRDGQSDVHRLSRPGLPEPRGLQRRWFDPLHLHGLAPSRRVAGRRPRRLWRAQNLCVWTKDNAGMGSLYRSQHELVFVFKHGRNGHRNNVQLGQFGRNRSNVWGYPGANSFARCSEEGNLLALHPTVKPVALVAYAILDCSARGDIVLDGFLGSGTTVIAAERTGRRCYGLELDPAYVDTVVRRWQTLTGDSARHAVSGRSFDDLAREAEVSDAA